MKPHSVLRSIGALIILTGLLGACGQKGPLHMPGTKEAKTSKSKQPLKPADSQPAASSSAKP